MADKNDRMKKWLKEFWRRTEDLEVEGVIGWLAWLLQLSFIFFFCSLSSVVDFSLRWDGLCAPLV